MSKRKFGCNAEGSVNLFDSLLKSSNQDILDPSLNSLTESVELETIIAHMQDTRTITYDELVQMQNDALKMGPAQYVSVTLRYLVVRWFQGSPLIGYVSSNASAMLASTFVRQPSETSLALLDAVIDPTVVNANANGPIAFDVSSMFSYLPSFTTMLIGAIVGVVALVATLVYSIEPKPRETKHNIQLYGQRMVNLGVIFFKWLLDTNNFSKLFDENQAFKEYSHQIATDKTMQTSRWYNKIVSNQTLANGLETIYHYTNLLLNSKKWITKVAKNVATSASFLFLNSVIANITALMFSLTPGWIATMIMGYILTIAVIAGLRAISSRLRCSMIPDEQLRNKCNHDNSFTTSFQLQTMVNQLYGLIDFFSKDVTFGVNKAFFLQVINGIVKFIKIVSGTVTNVWETFTGQTHLYVVPKALGARNQALVRATAQQKRLKNFDMSKPIRLDSLFGVQTPQYLRVLSDVDIAISRTELLGTLGSIGRLLFFAP